MNTKQLGIIGLLGAPFLGIGFYVEAYYPSLANSWWTGVWGMLYITGWMASMEVMRRRRLAGTDRFGSGIVWIVLGTLAVANISNIWQTVAPTYKPALFWVLDSCWPLSNLLMILVGVAVIRAKRLAGWHRWIPLVMGLWLPLLVGIKTVSIVSHIANIYSAAAWTLLAWIMLRESNRLQQGCVIVGIALRDEAQPFVQP